VFHHEHVLRTLTKIVDDATGCHRKLDAAEGLQVAQLDDGALIDILHGDVGRDGHLLVNVRMHDGVALASALGSATNGCTSPLVSS
jgi:pilus assembly protein CpaF